MEEGVFAAWLKKEGEKIAVGDPLFSLEGEKSLQDVEALDAGILRIPPASPKPGETVKVGQVIGYIAAENELDRPSAQQPAPEVKSQASAAAPVPAAPASDVRASEPRNVAPLSTEKAVRTPSTPRARRAADALQIDLSDVEGTGKGGRIRERDVKASAGSASANSRIQESPAASVPTSTLRRTIAERMTQSLSNTAPVTITTRVDATNLVNLRTELKRADGQRPLPSFTDLLLKITAAALLRHPTLGGQWQGESIALPRSIDIGLAVDTEHGLIVPVIRRVPELGLAELAETSRALIAEARARRIKPESLQGAIFTVTNLGSLGIDSFTPIINYPQVAILGIGAIRRVPAIIEDGTIAAQDQMTLSLTFDHRVVDGAPAARFLQSITQGVRNPLLSLLGFIPASDPPEKST